MSVTATHILSTIALTCLMVGTGMSGEIGVPVLLWRQRDPHTSQSLAEGLVGAGGSTVQQLDAQAFADDYLSTADTVVAFVQNRLSLEQFSAGSSDGHRELESVRGLFKDAAVAPTVLTDVLEPTLALKRRHFRHEDPDNSDITIKNGDKVWIEMPGDSLADNDRLIGELLSKIRENITKNTVFLITGRHNQFRSVDLEDRDEEDSRTKELKRVRRADPSPDPSVDKLLVKVGEAGKECLYYYTTNISVSELSAGKLTQLVAYNEPGIGDQGKLGESYCWVNTTTDGGAPEQTKAGLLLLTYTNGTLVTKFSISINSYYLTKGVTNFWNISSFEVTHQSVTYKMLAKDLTAEYKFGYSCSALTLVSELPKKGDTVDPDGKRLVVVLRRFQLQPFHNYLNQDIFTESFHCETWMTMPLWMGLLTLLVLFVILFMGLYFISIVNTPDRFENPKAKPLIITNADE